MSVDRSKVLAAAQKHLSKGNYDRAIGEYQRLVDDDPRDVRTWLKIGDLYTRKGAHREATQTYHRVAEHYADQGFFLKAVAVYKQILKLDPGRLDVSTRLAEMYENLQLVSDALSTYEQIAMAHARAGSMEPMLDTLGRMAKLDPDNIPVRIKYAEALSKASRTEDAAREFEAGAELLRDQGRFDDYLKVAERLLYHRPEDAALAKELAREYLERDDAKRALGKLQLCFKKDPKDVSTLELLARAFHMLGQRAKTISVYREMARILQESEKPEERARVLKAILELDPNDAEARQALAGYAPKARTPSSVDEVPPGAIVQSRVEAAPVEDDDGPELEIVEPDDDDVMLVDEFEDVDLDIAMDDAIDVYVAEPPPPPPPDLDAPPEFDELPATDGTSPSIRPPDILDELDVEPEPYRFEPPRDETDVSVEQPQSVRPSIPPDVAREAQIARLLTECEVFSRYGLTPKVITQLRQVLEIAPDHVEARERLKDALIQDGQPTAAAQELVALAGLFGDNPQVAQLYLRQAVELDPNNAQARDALGEPELEPAFPDEALPDQAFPQAYAEDEASEDGILFVDDEPSDAFAPITASEPPFEVDIAMQSPVRRSSIPEPPPELDAVVAEAEARQRNSMPPGEVEEILDEVDFYIAQGLWDAGSGTLQDALESFPGHPVLLDKLQEIEDGKRQQAVAASFAPPPAEDDAFALAEKLAEELGPPEADPSGSDVLDVDQVFEQFKRGVQEQIGMEDTDTHFDLGIAYKEMGLLDDAVGEFQLAMANPGRECLCQTMIGLCRIEQGKLGEAISHFKKGLYADTKSDAEELGLYYELGIAYELLDDPKEALYYYQKVQKRDPGFRGAPERIAALTSGGPPPSRDEPIALDEVDAAFDDLLSDE